MLIPEMTTIVRAFNMNNIEPNVCNLANNPILLLMTNYVTYSEVHRVFLSVIVAGAMIALLTRVLVCLHRVDIQLIHICYQHSLG